MRVLFVHGWGYGPGIWDDVIAQLSTEIDCPGNDYTVADLGFSGVEELPSGHFDIAIGHSMGVLWLLSQEGVTWDKLISICGFTMFTTTNDFPNGVSPRVVERMMRKLPISISSVLKAFHNSCEPMGAVPYDEIPNFNEARLKWGLELLRDGDCRPEFNPGNTFVLASKDDQIVPKEMTSALFTENEIKWVAGKGHLLPVTEPEVCCEVILSAISGK